MHFVRLESLKLWFAKGAESDSPILVYRTIKLRQPGPRQKTMETESTQRGQGLPLPRFVRVGSVKARRIC